MKQKAENPEIMRIRQMTAANREIAWQLEMILIYEHLEDDLEKQKQKERQERNQSGKL